MKIRSAEFIKSAVQPNQYPKANLPEIAFAGPSNVGKSSLINVIVNRKKLVQTSSTPGKTRLINFFNINDDLMLVDLPGYGFAKVSEAVKKTWGSMIETYLRERSNLILVIVILDVRRDLSDNDSALIEWLRHYRIHHVFVLTKTDKLSKNEVRKRQKIMGERLGISRNASPFLFSAETGEGKEKLWGEISKYLITKYRDDEDVETGL
jgi:GTP-binding protein